MNILDKLKIYKKNSLYADFLFSYPSTYLFQKKVSHEKVDIHQLFSFVKTGENILYIHIPFCYHICDFCNVYKEKVDFSLIEDYLSELFAEIEDVGRYIKKVQGIYIAGGTPTLLTENQLERLFQKIHKSCTISDDCYIEVDAFPSTLVPKKLEVLQKYGVHQLTIGIQSMQQEVLENVGRKGQSYTEIERLLHDIKDFDFRLHFDFIVGLPGENFEDLKRDVIYIAENFQPYSVSINSYDNTSDTILFQKEKEYFRQKEYKRELGRRTDILEKLLQDDYNITRKKTFYFQSFWQKHANIISVGAGAFGFINGYGVYRNALLKEYLEQGYTQKQIVAFSPYDYKVMFLTHNYEEDTINELYNSLFGTSIHIDFPIQIEELHKQGYIEILKNGNIKFLFQTSPLAYFHFIDFYTSDIVKLYDL